MNSIVTPVDSETATVFRSSYKRLIEINLSTGAHLVRYGRETDPDILTAIASDKSNKMLRKAVSHLAAEDAGNIWDAKGVYPRDRKFFIMVAKSVNEHGRLPAGMRDQVITRTMRYGRQLTDLFTPYVG